MVTATLVEVTVTLTPARALAGALRARGEHPRLQECRKAAEAVAASRGHCGDCVDPRKAAHAYLQVCRSVVFSEGAELSEWKRVFQASRLRVMLPGQKEVLRE